MAGHLCHAEDCEREVPPKLFACLVHWSMVPRRLQRALWAVYLPGQEQGKASVTRAYRLVQARCRLSIAEAEHKTEAVSAVLKDLHWIADPLLVNTPRSPGLFPSPDASQAAFLADVDALIDRAVREAPMRKAQLARKG